MDMKVTRRLVRPRAVLLASALAVASNASAELVPPEADLTGIVKNKELAIVLGKALFWDPDVGSDGMACASCHFSAGADSRIRNQMSPGLRQEPTADFTFGGVTDFDGEPLSAEALALAGLTKSGGTVDGTYEMTPEDFPFHSLEDSGDRNSRILATTNDVMSSSGSYDTTFGSVFGKEETCDQPLADVFHANGYPARQVEPRHTPTTINAVFNYLNFWDGRANHQFNGVDVFGPRDIANDPNKRLIVLDAGQPTLGHLAIENASLASQAVAPPLSPEEMSCNGRTFADVGRRVLANLDRPLELQRIHPDDSVLGPYVDPRTGRGLKREFNYKALIQQAFEERYWAAEGSFRIEDGQLIKLRRSRSFGDGYTQMEINFPMFWGIAIMLYESTLISDQSKFDTWAASCNPDDASPPPVPGLISSPVDSPNIVCQNPPADPTAPEHGGFTEEEVLGFHVFNTLSLPTGGPRSPGVPFCTGCHAAPLFSEAQRQATDTFVTVERSLIQGEGAVHDRGFFNIGTRPSSFDMGIGGKDPYGDPLSLARMFAREQAGDIVTDASGVTDPCNTPTLLEPGAPAYPGCDTTGSVDPAFDWNNERHMVGGGMKTPTLRNVGLTPPYFHYGGYSDLRSVVEFYVHGGNVRPKANLDASYTGDTSGTGPRGQDEVPVAGPDYGTNIDFFVRDLNVTDEHIDAMVAFMLTLTDPRVQCDAAPFDHPELKVPNGHTAGGEDIFALIPASGADGYAADSRPELCLPNTGDLFDPNLRNKLTPM